MTGIKGPLSKYSCPFCIADSSMMDWTTEKLESVVLSPRPAIEDYKLEKGSAYQRGKTYNLFGIRFNECDDKLPNIVPPILHIKLGFGNKIVSVLD